MTRKTLNVRFHNPNSPEVTANHILKIMIEANMGKVEKILQEVVADEKRKMKVKTKEEGMESLKKV